MLQAIRHDLFDIAARLRQIDSGYLIYYNNKLGRYEIHNSRQCADTFCLAVPYDCLDARTVKLVYATRVQNADAIFSSIERDNNMLELAQIKQSTDNTINSIQHNGRSKC